MKYLKDYIVERKITREDLPWLTKDCFRDAVNLWMSNCRYLHDPDFMSKYNLDEREISIIASLLSWLDSGIGWSGNLSDTDKAYEQITTINKRRLDTLIDSGSEGIVFDCGQYIIKLFTLPEGDAYYKRFINYIKKWISVSDSLTTIPHILKYDKKNYRWIAMEKFQTPCREGELLSAAMNDSLWYADEKEWTKANIKSFENNFTPEQQKWIRQWLKSYCKDYRKIMGDDTSINDDIRAKNIGKDKQGNIIIFDWCDIFNC